MAIKKDKLKVVPTVKREKTPEAIIVNKIIIRPVDRTSKDIQTWRTAHRIAEQIYHANRVRLYDLYADVILDGHLTGVIQRRIDSVLNKNLHFERDGKRDESFDDMCESEVMRKIITKLLESKLWGISGLEFIPGKEMQFEEVPRKHIKPSLKIISEEQYREEGWSYDNLQNVWIIGDKDDLGLLLKCSPYALWKCGNMADWAQYIEIFGQPVRIIKYDAYDLKTKMELQQVLDESGSSLALMIPKQADFDMKDGKQSNGDGKLQESFKTACNDEMSVIILTNTETTTSSTKSGYAQSKEHGKQQLEITKSDLKFVENLLNSQHFLSIVQSYGFNVEGGRFVFEKEIDLAELMDRVTIDTFVSEKVPIGDDYYYETYGIPKPGDYVALKKKMEDEKQMKLNPPSPLGEGKGVRPPKQKKPKTTNLSSEDKQSFLDKIRTTIADFFDPAHS